MTRSAGSTGFTGSRGSRGSRWAVLGLLSLVSMVAGQQTVVSCGPKVLQSSEVPRALSSPLYPNPAPPASCTWYILCPENMTLVIRLNDLDVEEDAKCKQDRSCCTHNWLTLGSERLCGKNDSQQEFIFNKPLNTVKFHSSKLLNGGRGFELIYFSCGADQFRCANGLGCYNPTERCDGVYKCADRSDEDDCEESTETIYHDCKSPASVPCGRPDPGCFHNMSGLCNDIVDCTVNGADEIYCGVCGRKKLYCRSGGCYPYWGACDGVTHCFGGWDEGELAGCGICPSGYAPCSREDDCHCFHTKEQRCDERMDCPHGEDEVSCVAGCEDKIACASVQGCYSPSERCDGIAQCSDKSDEAGCVSQLTATKFKCANGLQCLDELYVCNGIEDCSDGSDEADCVKTSVITIVVMGTLTCGMLAVMGTAFGWRYYVARIRANTMDAHSSYQRQIDQGPLDEETLYHLYRDPPPSYHEAVLQGASPPVYCHPTRFVSLSNLPETTPPAAAPRRVRVRGATSRRGIRQVPKPIELAKPLEDSTLTPSNSMASAVLAGDQLYPESGPSRDIDAPMLELSDNTTNNHDHLSDLESNSSGATCGSDLISNESPSSNHNRSSS